VYDGNGTLGMEIPDAFPSLPGAGARSAGGDVLPGGVDEILAVPGPVPSHPPLVRGFDAAGTPLAAIAFAAYGASGFGADVASGRIDGAARILTGPGPSPIYGPHVRAFGVVSGSVVALAKVSFFAYGTLRYGLHVRAGDLDGDGFEELLTGAGPGAPFGPHVRAFDYDGAALAGMPAVNFFAYATLSYGAEVAGGDLDGDGYAEILTGPGPSQSFAANSKGFDYDNAGARLGVIVAAADLDRDGRAEVVAGAGPDPFFASAMRAFDYTGTRFQLVPALDLDVFGTTHGIRTGSGDLGY
jgi:serralysin